MAASFNVTTIGGYGLYPLSLPPRLDVRASLRERPIMPAPGRAQGGVTNGARAEQRRAGLATDREGVGREGCGPVRQCRVSNALRWSASRRGSVGYCESSLRRTHANSTCSFGFTRGALNALREQWKSISTVGTVP